MLNLRDLVLPFLLFDRTGSFLNSWVTWIWICLECPQHTWRSSFLSARASLKRSTTFISQVHWSTAAFKEQCCFMLFFCTRRSDTFYKQLYTQAVTNLILQEDKIKMSIRETQLVLFSVLWIVNTQALTVLVFLFVLLPGRVCWVKPQQPFILHVQLISLAGAKKASAVFHLPHVPHCRTRHFSSFRTPQPLNVFYKREHFLFKAIFLVSPICSAARTEPSGEGRTNVPELNVELFKRLVILREVVNPNALHTH